MSLNPEIHCICRKLKSPKNVVEKADYFLRKLNRKTNGSMGSVDMLKYLICIDLSYRDLGLKWDINIANKLGLKSKQYHNAFNKIQNKLNISKNKTISFDALSKHFKCNHIKSSFDKIYKKYQTKKLNDLPIIQRKYTNLATPVHKAAVFYVVATKHGKMKVDGPKLCNLMHCEYKKFEMLCGDVRRTCFDSSNNTKTGNNNSRKRKRDEMEMEDEGNEDMFCDEYETRKDRKYKEWKERVLKQDEETRKKRNGNMIQNGNNNKRRKVMNTNKNKPTKMFSIFDKAKKKKKENESDDIKNDDDGNNVIEIDDNDNDEDEDIDLKEREDVDIVDNVDNMDNVDNSKQNNDSNEGLETNMNINENKPISAREAAAIAALKRQQFMMTKKTVETNDKSTDNP